MQNETNFNVSVRKRTKLGIVKILGEQGIQIHDGSDNIFQVNVLNSEEILALGKCYSRIILNLIIFPCNINK